MSGVILSIENDSIAEELEWLPGDEIVSINDHKLRDIIDYQYYCADEYVNVLIKRGDQSAEFEIEKDIDDTLGVTFTEELFDGVITCGANCIFCFVEQLPKGLRKPLYLKDDDYRLSFIHGNYITLANVTDDDIDRIIEQKLSPLYVSVHSTDPELRRKIIGREASDILQQLKRLTDGKIKIHAQIVLCRGINDGKYLQKSIEDLSAFYPYVSSVAVVPVGLTSHRKNKTHIEPIDSDYSKSIINTIKNHQTNMYKKHSTRFIWAADEFYLNAGINIPSTKTYEGFPQYENGVGIVRYFLDDEKKAERILNSYKSCKSKKIAIITGKIAEPVITNWVEKISNSLLSIEVIGIENTLFGNSVTVTGLIPGKEVIKQLKDKKNIDTIIIPEISLRDGIFIDDVSVEDIKLSLITDNIYVVESSPIGLAKKIMELTNEK